MSTDDDKVLRVHREIRDAVLTARDLMPDDPDDPAAEVAAQWFAMRQTVAVTIKGADDKGAEMPRGVIRLRDTAWYAVTVTAEREDWHREAAHAAIAKPSRDTLKPYTELAAHDDVVRRVADRIGELVRDWRRELAVELAPGGRCADALPVERIAGDVLAFDAVFADWLAEQGAPEDMLAREREAARDRSHTHEKQLRLAQHDDAALWYLWVPRDYGRKAPRFLRRIADCVWDGCRDVRDTSDRLIAPAQVDVVASMFTSTRIRYDETTQRIVDNRGRPTNIALLSSIPRERADVVREMTRVVSGLDKLSSLTWYRIRSYLANRAFGAAVANDPRPEEVMIEGGWHGFAAALGLKSGKAPDEIREIVNTAAGLRFVVDDTSIPLLGEVHTATVYPELRQRPGRSARIRIRLSAAWVPNQPQLHGYDLIPIVSVPPVGSLNPRSHGAAARADLLAMIEMRTYCTDILDYGGVRLDWSAIAEQAELPSQALREALDLWRGTRWQQTGDRWMPGPSKDMERPALMLREAAEMSRAAQARGRLRADRKRDGSSDKG
jgi:hypothetical protein